MQRRIIIKAGPGARPPKSEKESTEEAGDAEDVEDAILAESWAIFEDHRKEEATLKNMGESMETLRLKSERSVLRLRQSRTKR